MRTVSRHLKAALEAALRAKAATLQPGTLTSSASTAPPTCTATVPTTATAPIFRPLTLSTTATVSSYSAAIHPNLPAIARQAAQQAVAQALGASALQLPPTLVPPLPLHLPATYSVMPYYPLQYSVPSSQPLYPTAPQLPYHTGLHPAPAPALQLPYPTAALPLRLSPYPAVALPATWRCTSGAGTKPRCPGPTAHAARHKFPTVPVGVPTASCASTRG